MRIVINGGFWKSGSTFLYNLFDKHKDINVINMRTKHDSNVCSLGFTLINMIYSSNNLENNLERFEELLISVCQKDKINYIEFPLFINPKSIDLLGKMSIDLKVLFTIRNQMDIIISRYNHDFLHNDFLFDKKRVELKDVLSEKNLFCIFPLCRYPIEKEHIVCTGSCSFYGHKMISLPNYDYFQLYKTQVEIVGSKNLFMMPNEYLKNERQKALKDLKEFMNLKSDFDLKLLEEERNVSEYKFDKKNIIDTYGDRITSYYKDSNRMLNEELKYDLLSLGYPI